MNFYKMVSVIIRNKNESPHLQFLLPILVTRYKKFIHEIIIIDNMSTDDSREIALKYGCKIVPIEKFEYGVALNLGISTASSDIVCSFSPYCYPINEHFFYNIIYAFNSNSKLAGIRPLQRDADYRFFLEGKSAADDLSHCGLVNSTSAIRKSVWEKYRFHDTMFGEDKDWTMRVLRDGYEVRFCESFVSYDKKRSAAALFSRYKSEYAGRYKLFGTRVNLISAIKLFVKQSGSIFITMFRSIYYAIKTLIFHLRFLFTSKKSK